MAGCLNNLVEHRACGDAVVTVVHALQTQDH